MCEKCFVTGAKVKKNDKRGRNHNTNLNIQQLSTKSVLFKSLGVEHQAQWLSFIPVQVSKMHTSTKYTIDLKQDKWLLMTSLFWSQLPCSNYSLQSKYLTYNILTYAFTIYCRLSLHIHLCITYHTSTKGEITKQWNHIIMNECSSLKQTSSNSQPGQQHKLLCPQLCLMKV